MFILLICVESFGFPPNISSEFVSCCVFFVFVEKLVNVARYSVFT